jgi:Tfp pilus assembly protein PilF
MYPEAEQHLASCQSLRDMDTEVTVPLALERLLLEAQTGNIHEVEDVLWGELKKKKAEATLILEALAKGYARMLRMGAAMRCWSMLLEREPDNVDALLNLGRLLEFAEPEEGLKKFRRALELDAERDDVRLALALYNLHHNPDEALPLFEDLLTRQPDNFEAMLGLAQAYRASPNPERARPLLEQVLEHKPNDSRALTLLGSLDLTSSRKAEAEALFRKAIAADRANADAYYQLYLTLIQQPGREAEAAAQLALHKRVSDDSARLVQLASKDMNQAPNDPNLLCEMGVLFLRNGKPEIGMRWLYAALKFDPSHQASHQALYDYFKQIGDSERAEMHRLQIRPGEAKSPAPKSGG